MDAGLTLALPMLFFCLAVLLPTHIAGGTEVQKCLDKTGPVEPGTCDANTYTSFDKSSMSNIKNGSNLFFVHVGVMWIVTGVVLSVRDFRSGSFILILCPACTCRPFVAARDAALSVGTNACQLAAQPDQLLLFMAGLAVAFQGPHMSALSASRASCLHGSASEYRW